MTYYIEISPRGFANETTVYGGTKQQVAACAEIINNNPNAWARPRKASHPAVRAALKAVVNHNSYYPHNPISIPAIPDVSVDTGTFKESGTGVASVLFVALKAAS